MLERLTMQVNRNFKPETAETLEIVPIKDLENFLAKYRKTDIETKSDSPKSRWQKIAHRIKNDPKLNDPKSDETWEHIRKCSKEFRNEFAFKHDLEEE
jgi:hypothetical protein